MTQIHNEMHKHKNTLCCEADDESPRRVVHTTKMAIS